jgi:hypothetical protein
MKTFNEVFPEDIFLMIIEYLPLENLIPFVCVNKKLYKKFLPKKEEKNKKESSSTYKYWLYMSTSHYKHELEERKKIPSSINPKRFYFFQYYNELYNKIYQKVRKVETFEGKIEHSLIKNSYLYLTDLYESYKVIELLKEDLEMYLYDEWIERNFEFWKPLQFEEDYKKNTLIINYDRNPIKKKIMSKSYIKEEITKYLKQFMKENKIKFNIVFFHRLDLKFMSKTTQRKIIYMKYLNGELK